MVGSRPWLHKERTGLAGELHVTATSALTGLHNHSDGTVLIQMLLIIPTNQECFSQMFVKQEKNNGD